MSGPPADGLRDFREDLGQLDDDRRARIDARVRAVVDGEVWVAPDGGARPPGPTRSSWLAVAAAAVVLALVGLGVVLSGDGSDPVETASAPLPASIEELAGVAGGQPDLALGPDQYAHRVVVRGSRSDRETIEQREEVWVAADARAREVFGEQVITAGSTTSTRRGGENTYAAGEYPAPLGLSDEQLRGLPDDPAAMVAAVRAIRDTSPELLPRLLVEVMAWPTTPPAVRAAGLRWLGDQGAIVSGPATDPTGREGVGVVLTMDAGSLEVVVDPTTAQPRSSTWHGADGSTTWLVFETSSVVSNPG